MEIKKMLQLVSKDTGVKSSQAEQVIKLLEEGNTVPFIARYRKEQTSSLDEVQIKAVEDRYNYIQQLEQRKEEILRLIEEQGKLTEELTASINNATVLQRLEDLYRPYKQKRRTKATIAKEKGLEPLAALIMTFPKESISKLAEGYLNEELEVLSVEDALLGARDILAEQFADDAKIREQIRNITRADGKIITSVKKAELDEKNVFEMY
ncbi:MAG: Tex-like N-terminal domain-containing protein, partial [Psychrobacillus psychrotolerans]|uniref:Tex-like N-terminal domain-containing protein n=1 Tax=Psychrobacillus psychrotolerans TaxID=126156 RepID=UPI003BB1E5E4